MKSISFIQAYFNTGSKTNSYFLPYSAGCIWSYLQSLSDNPYTLNKLVFKREPIEELAHELQNDTIVGFSCYIWNRNYNLKLAKRLKELNPNIKIVFGGPELEVTDPDFFSLHPYIDVHVINEGELVFADLVYNIDNLPSVNGIIFNQNNTTVRNPPAKRIDELSLLPSPYLDGTFNKLAKDNPDIEWNCTIETNRGCPYKCTFCDWGSLTYSKIKKFSLERVFSELDWVFNHNCFSVELADANFGIFVERDNLIVDEFIRLTNKYDRQIHFATNWAKNQNKAIVGLVKKLISDGRQTNAFVTISLQSLTDSVLEAINRKNLHVNKFNEIYEDCQKNNVPLSTEIIIGLPNETFTTYKQSYYKLFSVAPNIHVNIYKLTGLNNAELYLTKQDGAEFSKIFDWLDSNTDDIDEEYKWVKSTNSMSYDDMYSATEFSCFINTFHMRGLTNLISRHLNDSGLMTYEDFYEKLYLYIKKQPFFKDYFNYFREQYDQWYLIGKSNFHSISSVNFHANNYLYHLFLKLHHENKIKFTFELIQDFLDDQAIFINKVFDLQKESVITFTNQTHYPKDVHGYELYNSSEVFDKFDDFISKLYFYRMSSYGKALIKHTSLNQAA